MSITRQSILWSQSSCAVLTGNSMILEVFSSLNDPVILFLEPLLGSSTPTCTRQVSPGQCQPGLLILTDPPSPTFPDKEFSSWCTSQNSSRLHSATELPRALPPCLGLLKGFLLQIKTSRGHSLLYQAL